MNAVGPSFRAVFVARAIWGKKADFIGMKARGSVQAQAEAISKAPFPKGTFPGSRSNNWDLAPGALHRERSLVKPGPGPFSVLNSLAQAALLTLRFPRFGPSLVKIPRGEPVNLLFPGSLGK